MDESQIVDASSQAAQTVSENVESVNQAVKSVDLTAVHQGITAINGNVGDLVTLVTNQQESVNTLLSGLVTVQMFTLLSQLLLLGVALVVVFVVALRRF